ncbi:hypothetical protein ACHAQE_011093 [Botrytis cinerea]
MCQNEELGVDSTQARYNNHLPETVSDENLEDVNEHSDSEEISNRSTSVKLEMSEEKIGSIMAIQRDRSPNDNNLWVLRSFIIHSSQLKENLRRVLRGHSDALDGESDFVLARPFECVFHSWSHMTALNEQADNTLAQFKVLYNILSKNLGDTFNRIDAILANQSITYDWLWAIYRHNDIITTPDTYNELMAFRTLRCEYQTGDKPHFIIHCEYIDTDGTTFGLVSTTCRIMQFEGIRKIERLNCPPVRLLPSEMQMWVATKLLKRGQQFADFARRDFYHADYDGLEYMIQQKKSPEDEDPEKAKPRKTKGGIIIDPKAFDHHNSEQAPKLTEFPAGFGNKKHKPTRLFHGDEFMLCGSTVRGYSLSSKSWAIFLIGEVEEIQWNTTREPKLILPNDYKWPLSLVEQKIRADNSADELAEQKGRYTVLICKYIGTDITNSDKLSPTVQGLIFLLSGNAGMSKTLTAEIIAEEQHLPFYVISASDLGSDPFEFEQKITSIQKTVTRWKAILLIDEVDVFLEEPPTSDSARNGLVSVFYQILERYPGILFLTTNGPAVLDQAIISRVHVEIHIPNLDREMRRNLWQMFIEQSKVENILCAEDFDTLAELAISANEMKNAIKSSVSIAGKNLWPPLPLGIDHLRCAISLPDDFPEWENLLEHYSTLVSSIEDSAT